MIWDWLIELEGAGPVRRWSVGDDYDVTDGTLVHRYVRALSPLQVAQGDDEIEVEVYDPGTDWPVVAPAMHQAVITLRRWMVGTELGAAEVYARGRAANFEHGARNEVARFQIVPQRQAPLPEMPDQTSTVSATTWPSTVDMLLHEEHQGRYYPVVFGYPGYRPGWAVDDCFPCVPAPFAQEPGNRSLIALYAKPWNIISEDPTTTSPSEVVIRNQADEQQIVLTCQTANDLLGKTVVAVGYTDPVDALRLTPLDNDEIMVGYRPSGDPTPIRDAYSVIAYVLGRWARETVDWGRMRAVQRYLERFQVDTWIDERVEGGAWAWVAALVSDLRVQIRTGSRGWYLEHIHIKPDPSRTRRAVVVGEGCERLSSIAYVGDPFSRLVARFGDVSWMGGLVGRVAYGPETTPYDWELAHGTLAISEARYGRRDVGIELPWTFDERTTQLVAEEVIEAEALPHREVTLAVQESWQLQSQQQIEITDEAAGLDGVLGIVTDPPVVGGPLVSIRVRLP